MQDQSVRKYSSWHSWAADLIEVCVFLIEKGVVLIEICVLLMEICVFLIEIDVFSIEKGVFLIKICVFLIVTELTFDGCRADVLPRDSTTFQHVTWNMAQDTFHGFSYNCLDLIIR